MRCRDATCRVTGVCFSLSRTRHAASLHFFDYSHIIAPFSLPPLTPRPPSRARLCRFRSDSGERMGIRSPLWGRSHIDGCSKGPSRPGGGDCAGCFVVGLSRILFICCFLVVHFVVFGFSEKHISPHRGVMLSESGMHAFQRGKLCFPSRGVMLSNVGSYAFRVGDACFPRETLLPSLRGATGVFRAATDMAVAPQRGANPHSFSAIATKAAKPSARRRTGQQMNSLLYFDTPPTIV